MMSYDNMRNGEKSKHSTYQFAMTTVENAIKGGLDSRKMALGVPFYARNMQTGDWKTYEEIVRDLRESQGLKLDEIKKLDSWKGYYYNGYDMIVRKTLYAMKKRIGGIMIWENGQDVHNHPLSLLGAISTTVNSDVPIKSEL